MAWTPGLSLRDTKYYWPSVYQDTGSFLGISPTLLCHIPSDTLSKCFKNRSPEESKAFLSSRTEAAGWVSKLSWLFLLHLDLRTMSSEGSEGTLTSVSLCILHRPKMLRYKLRDSTTAHRHCEQHCYRSTRRQHDGFLVSSTVISNTTKLKP